MSPMYQSKKSSKRNRKRTFFRKNYRWNRNSPSNYNDRTNLIGKYDFPGRPDTCSPLGFSHQNCEYPINGPPLEIVSPNPQFSNPSFDNRRRSDDNLSPYPDPKSQFSYHSFDNQRISDGISPPYLDPKSHFSNHSFDNRRISDGILPPYLDPKSHFSNHSFDNRRISDGILTPYLDPKSQFSNHSFDNRRISDGILPPYPEPKSQFSNPSFDNRRRSDDNFSHSPDLRYNFLPSLFQSGEYYSGSYQADSVPFPPRRSGFPKEDLIPEMMKPTRDLSRRSDSGTPREEGRYRDNYKGSEFMKIYGSVSPPPRFKERSSRNHKVGAFANERRPHGSSRKYEGVSRTKTKENPKEGSILKMSPDRKRKCSTESPRVEIKYREKSKEVAVAEVNTSKYSKKNNDSQASAISVSNSKPTKLCDNVKIQKISTTHIIQKNRGSDSNKKVAVANVNPSNCSSRKFDDISPQVEVNTSEDSKKNNDSQASVTSVSSSKPTKSCDNVKIRKISATRIFPKNCGSDSKEVPIVKLSPARNFSKTCDADSPKVDPKTGENMNSSNDNLGKCVLPSQVQAASEILNKGKLFVDLKVNVENDEPRNSAMPHSKFKIRKISANRQLPKHCGSLAPRVTIRRNDENLAYVVKDNTKSKVINDNMEGIQPGVDAIDVDQVVNEVKADDVEKVLNEPISPKDFEKVENETVLLDDVERKSNDPILTNVSVESARAKSVESFETLNDHTLDEEDDVAPIEEQTQPSADISLDCEYEKGRNEEARSSGFQFSEFEENRKEARSEDECSLVDAAFLCNSDFLPNEDNVKALGVVSVDCETVNKRKQVKETIDTYDRILTKLLEANKAALSIGKEKVYNQAHTEAAMLLKRDKKWVNTEQVLGHVPGIEVGDRFCFRAELVCIGLHRILQAGIDYMKTKDGKILAISIVDSGRYANDAESSDILIYCGHGGNPTVGKVKRPQDQKLERGNLAMKNSMEAKTPVRVIRKVKKSVLMYYYDGLYVVTKFIQERSLFGKLVYKFQLDRIVSSEANVTQVEKIPFLVEDISLGKEKIPINVVNTVDNEPFPVFNYISKMTYPESCYQDIVGCGCTDGCINTNKCVCVVKNGGEIPFDDNGAIVVKPKSKRFIYECGPSCKCPSSCKNRVSQYGIRYPLGVFKTESMGWGVRSPNYIPAGSFICEYVGELLQDEEAEQRNGNDEYLFDIDNDGYTIDAAKYGNVGRFINHSCSPNLYAQNVLYDHGNKRMPHVMFFAVNGIYPFQELTYDYNYKLDKVLDSEGNIKRKACHCGSLSCTGRLY